MINSNNSYLEDLKWFHYKDEPEYNLTIQQVMQKENIGKHYKMDSQGDDLILWLTEEYEELKLLIVKDVTMYDESLYCEIQDDIVLEEIVSTKYKEVQYQC